MDIKIKIFGRELNLVADNLKDLREEFKLAVVTKIFQREYARSASKSSAVLNTAAILDVDERYVWKILKDWETRYVQNAKTN